MMEQNKVGPGAEHAIRACKNDNASIAKQNQRMHGPIQQSEVTRTWNVSTRKRLHISALIYAHIRKKMQEFLTSARIYVHTENTQTEMIHVSQKETQTEEVY